MVDRSKDVWSVVFYDGISLINKLNFYNIEVYGFKKIADYKYSFETFRKNRKIIKKNFKESKIISKKGIVNWLEEMLLKTTSLCIVVAFLFMHNVSKRIWKIDITGDYVQVESIIKDELIKNNIYVRGYYPSDKELKEIEDKISLYLSKEIEFLELRRKGSVLMLRYQKRRTSTPLEGKGNNLYATKDGMIKYFNVKSGVKQVKEYDYVKKGDLLVKDVVETSDGQLIDVGTIGGVFANTFYVIDVEVENDSEDEAVVFSKMLDKAKYKIGSYISKDEKIEIERILSYSIDKEVGRMKVYYMLLEDITI